MITTFKEPLKGTPDGIQAKLEELTSGQARYEYLAGTRLRQLAVELAMHDELNVTMIVYDDASQELEVTLKSAPHHDPVLVNRSGPGSHCQITLEQWLTIDTQPGIEESVNIIHSVLKASVPPSPRDHDTAEKLTPEGK